jgi:hypothetical protein
MSRLLQRAGRRGARLAALAVGLGLACGALPAAGRVEAGSGYSKAQTFSAALRYLRVDRGYEVVEKDPDAAYLLFRYPVAGQTKGASGSLEVVETGEGVKIFLQLPRLPAYHESMLRDGLLRKLREEYGEPPKKAPAKPDGGTAGRAGAGPSASKD